MVQLFSSNYKGNFYICRVNLNMMVKAVSIARNNNISPISSAPSPLLQDEVIDDNNYFILVRIFSKFILLFCMFYCSNICIHDACTLNRFSLKYVRMSTGKRQLTRLMLCKPTHTQQISLQSNAILFDRQF